MSITEKITEIMEKARDNGISPEELCQKAEIDRSTLQRWKSGKTNPIWSNLDKLEKAAEANK